MVFVAALAASTIGTLRAVAGPERLANVLVSELTQPPPGWIEFCARQPGECASTMTAPQNPTLSRKAWRDLIRVNNWVNETIKPLTDLEHWGVVERWSYPDDGYGNCEDYALLKRRTLIEALAARGAAPDPRAGRGWRRSCGADGDNRQGRLCP